MHWQFASDQISLKDKSYIFKSSNDELENLKSQLQKAVEAEEYEKAAKLRDKIKKLETGS